MLKSQRERTELGENKYMDIFDVLRAISKRKIEIMRDGMNDKDAIIKAEFDVSKEYNISLLDIKKLNRT